MKIKKWIFIIVLSILALKVYSIVAFEDVTTFGIKNIPYTTICDESLNPPIKCK